jgi:hypothetical protein
MLFPKLYRDASMCAPGIRLWIRKTLGAGLICVERRWWFTKDGEHDDMCCKCFGGLRYKSSRLGLGFWTTHPTLLSDSKERWRPFMSVQKHLGQCSWTMVPLECLIGHKTLVFPLVSLKTFSTITATKNWSSSLLWKCSKVQRCTRHEFVCS